MMRACRWPGCARWPSSSPLPERCCCSPRERGCGSGCGRTAPASRCCAMRPTSVSRRRCWRSSHSFFRKAGRDGSRRCSRRSGSARRINDITTDTEKPPQFKKPLPYGGPQVAEQQRKAYPDIQPAVLAAGPEAAFARALAAAQAMGWDIVDAQPKEGRIEATATTFWFGFKDDVVVRITPLPAGSRIDVRSKSRVGRGDTGTNAQRVRAYLKRLN